MAAEPALIQARQHFQAGRIDQARQLVLRFLQRHPGHPEANHSMAVMLLHKRELEPALYHARRAAAASPETTEYLFTAASILMNLDNRAEAASLAHRAMEQGARDAHSLLRLLPLFWEMGDHEGALHAGERAFALDPSRARAPYASVLSNIGEADRAVPMLRDQLARDPEAIDALQALALAMNYTGADATEVFDVHRRFGAALEKLHAPGEATLHNPDPERSLRIGLVSPDFYSHSVAFFAEPILRHLPGHRFEVFCYSSRPYPDDTTRRLKGLAAGWRDIAGQPDSEVARLIRSDRIDILMDLTGLTTGNALSVFAARAAPIQVSAIGYPNTTGLSTMDYRLVDAITDPPGAQAFATERLLHLRDCFLCYRPVEETPPLPDRPPRPITFGSFNTAQKLVGEVIPAWARIVNAVPGSNLILKASQFSCPMVRSRFEGRFRAAGLDPARLELLPVIRDKAAHLALYGRIDIALDAFPYNGTTTTCEALHMGIPIVTLRGSSHAGRVGASLLSAVNLPDLIAESVDEYAAIANRLAGDPQRLATLRATLRNRMLASPLCDGPGYGAWLADALRQAWRSRCSKQPSPANP